MLSDEKIGAYRRMTPEERWREVEELMTIAWRSLLELPEEERQRRLTVIRDLDLDHLKTWATKLGVAGRLDGFLRER